MKYKPLFPWFGGKAPVAETVWSAFGEVCNYVEPFFGSGAMLFMSPYVPRVETVNDADGFVANFWRAAKHDPDAVAEHADNPVNECDLHARHLWLIGRREAMTDRLCGDPDWFDAKAAGWWAWGQSCWIGSGWCSGDGPWQSVDGLMVKGDAGSGVNRQLPHLGGAGRGVIRKGSAATVEDTIRAHREHLREQIGWFSNRLRHTRVCCGDWARVTGPSVTINHGITAVFLDPPYSAGADRDMGCYAVDCGSVAHAVRAWALEQGGNPLMRIVLAGYDGEGHEELERAGWRVESWKARGGYGSQGGDESRGRANAHRERLWFSPHCLRSGESLFGGSHD